MGNLTSLAGAGAAAERPASSRVEVLVIGTCVLAVIATAFIVLRARRRGGADGGKRFWAAWALVLAASACAALWIADFLGSDSLGWTVPTLGAIEVGLFALGYPQRNGSPPERAVPSTDSGRIRATTPTINPTPGLSPNAVEMRTINQEISDHTLADLRDVIRIVAECLRTQGQVASAVTFCRLAPRLPTANADARQLWEAVFDAALEEDRLVSLLSYVRDHLGRRPKLQLEGALNDIGITI